jgi:hypothetical protein
MIDHLMAFPTEPDAFNDPVVGQYHELGFKGSPPYWHAECSPNVLVWDPADDTTEIVPGPDGDREVVVHHPIDDQFRVVITLSEQSDDLMNHLNLEMAADHETRMVLGGSFTTEQLTVLHMQPVFSGSEYPFLTGQGGMI